MSINPSAQEREDALHSLDLAASAIRENPKSLMITSAESCYSDAKKAERVERWSNVGRWSLRALAYTEGIAGSKYRAVLTLCDKWNW